MAGLEFVWSVKMKDSESKNIAATSIYSGHEAKADIAREINKALKAAKCERYREAYNILDRFPVFGTILKYFGDDSIMGLMSSLYQLALTQEGVSENEESALDRVRCLHAKRRLVSRRHVCHALKLIKAKWLRMRDVQVYSLVINDIDDTSDRELPE